MCVYPTEQEEVKTPGALGAMKMLRWSFQKEARWSLPASFPMGWVPGSNISIPLLDRNQERMVVYTGSLWRNYWVRDREKMFF